MAKVKGFEVKRFLVYRLEEVGGVQFIGEEFFNNIFSDLCGESIRMKKLLQEGYFILELKYGRANVVGAMQKGPDAVGLEFGDTKTEKTGAQTRKCRFSVDRCDELVVYSFNFDVQKR